MTTRALGVMLLAGVLTSCSDGPTSSTPRRLEATVTPNPLVAPASAPADVMWNLQLRASGSGAILIERGEARLLDAAGAIVGQTNEVWSQSAGCASCSGDVRIADGGSESHVDKRIRFIGGAAPVRFVYTIHFADELGRSSTTAEVPVR